MNRWDTSEMLKTKAAILDYLSHVIDHEDRALLALALFNVARSDYVNQWPAPSGEPVAAALKRAPDQINVA
jgi:DNA-binding phage protein